MERIRKYWTAFKKSATTRSLQVSLILSMLVAIPFIIGVMGTKIKDDTKTVKYETEQMASDIKFILFSTNQDHDEGEKNLRKVFSHYEIFKGDTFMVLDEDKNKEPQYKGTSERESYISSPIIKFIANAAAKMEADRYQKDWIAPTKIYTNKENGHLIYSTKHHVAHGEHIDEIIIERDLTEIYAKPVRNGLRHSSIVVLFGFVIAFVLYNLSTKRQTKIFKKVIAEQYKLMSEGDLTTNVGKQYGEHLEQVSSTLIKMYAQANDIYEINKNSLQNVSHEINSCLSEIKSSADLIRYYGVSKPENVLPQLERVDGAVAKISAIQRAFTELASIERATSLQAPSSISVKELLNYVISEAHNEYSQVDFMLGDADTEKKIKIHKQYFILIMRILLENAVKYSINSKHVRIDVLTDTNFKEKVAVKVTNWGVYIPKEERERIFERYYRARNVKDISGLGLGLHIIKKIIRLYDGEILVESDPSGETSFIIVFPEG